jgi:hypothetical protein
MLEPHPRLVPLLRKFDIYWEAFKKKGRPPAGVREKRADIVTALHESGCSWAEMQAITGFTVGSINNLTRAVGCPAMKEKRKNLGISLGKSWAGKKRPGQLEKQWAHGDFKALKGRVRSASERQHLREGWTPARRKDCSSRSLKTWANPGKRAQLLAFHRSPEERLHRSQAQIERMGKDPIKWTRGKGAWITSSKSNPPRFWVRSSFETAACALLEEDTQVTSFFYELVLKRMTGGWMRPDFVVQYIDGRTVLVEVKAKWVLQQPDEAKVQIRLAVAKAEAYRRGWDFAIWTEDELSCKLK